MPEVLLTASLVKAMKRNDSWTIENTTKRERNLFESLSVPIGTELKQASFVLPTSILVLSFIQHNIINGNPASELLIVIIDIAFRKVKTVLFFYNCHLISSVQYRFVVC